MKKFTNIVGNPPYTRDVGGGNTQSIYQEFFEIAIGIGRANTLLTPARWFNSALPAMKTFRKTYMTRLNSHTRTINYISDSKKIFPKVEIEGGVSWWLFDWGYEGDTQFVIDWIEERGKRKLIENQILNLSPNRIELLRKTKEENRLKILSFKASIEGSFTKIHNSSSTATMLEHTTENRQNETDGRIRIPKHGWRFLPEEYIVEGKSVVPRNKYALAFTHISRHNNSRSLNDRTFFLHGGETAKSTMAIILDTPNQAYNLYKYARSKFFCRLVEGRLSSRHTFPQAYQDVPAFNFDVTDLIDWSKSIPEIDAQLEEHFGLEELHDWLQAVDTPFANVPKEEYLQSWEELGVDVSDAAEWY